MSDETERLKKLGEDASPAPWLRYRNLVGPGWTVPTDPEPVSRVNLEEADVEFVTTIRNCWDQLLAVVATAAKLNDSCEELAGGDRWYDDSAKWDLERALVDLKRRVNQPEQGKP